MRLPSVRFALSEVVYTNTLKALMGPSLEHDIGIASVYRVLGAIKSTKVLKRIYTEEKLKLCRTGEGNGLLQQKLHSITKRPQSTLEPRFRA